MTTNWQDPSNLVWYELDMSTAFVIRSADVVGAVTIPPDITPATQQYLVAGVGDESFKEVAALTSIVMSMSGEFSP